MDKVKCAKCGKDKDPILIRKCLMLKKDVCLDCCLRCMFQTGGKCMYKEAIK